MFQKQKNLSTLSVTELERILKIKRRKARQERFIRLSAEGASASAALLADDVFASPLTPAIPLQASNIGRLSIPQIETSETHVSDIAIKKYYPLREKILLAIELSAVVCLFVLIGVGYFQFNNLNLEMVEARNASQASVIIPIDETDLPSVEQHFNRLPGGHTSPTSEGGSIPDVPSHLQNWVQPSPSIPVPMQVAAPATRIVIPKINVDAPIVEGVAWEDLKKGVGHLPSSAQPGERGNLYLAAHNDIFGEIFRNLDELEKGDAFFIYAGKAKYRYVVNEKRIINPTDVEVMLPTTKPVVTLQTCHPYLIDTHRLVVIADLDVQ